VPRITYVEQTFRSATLDLITTADQICTEYEQQGLTVTLRQLYYQFVSRGYIENSLKSYKRLGEAVNNARLGGLLDWNHIVDRTRNVRDQAHWVTPESIVAACAAQYQTERWATQPNRVEVWIEKDALLGAIDRVCARNDVPYFSCRGYTSQSELWSAARRLSRCESAGQHTVVIHLGDHDPSGVDMTRDIQERLHLFGSTATVRRIALNMPQVEQYDPPPNPAKLTDSRATGYISAFGESSWELDALDPATLDRLIDTEIRSWRDEDQWAADTERMQRQRAVLTAVSRRWSDIEALVNED
jgi:hypothetical protein